MRKLTSSALDSALSARDFVVGVSEARTALLDLERLFSTSGFEVRDEAG
jgi:hypothetical protein